MKKASGLALFAITVMAVAVMWLPDYWVTALPAIAVFLLAAAWLIRCAFRPRELCSDPLLVLVGAVALWPAGQLLLGATVYRWATVHALLYWAAAAAVVFLSAQTFSDAPTLRFYLRALVVLGFLIALEAPLQLFTANAKIFWLFEAPYSNIAMGPFVYPNQYAAFIELVLPVALTQVFSERAGWRMFHGLAAVMMYASLLAATSRMGLVLATLEILVVPVLAAKRTGFEWRQVVMPGAIFFGMLLVLGLAVGPEAVIAKLQQKDPYAGRREFTESSLRMIRDRPFSGVGLGNWSTAYPEYATFDDGLFANEAHNDWAQWAVEGGVFFAALMLVIATRSAFLAFRTGWGLGVVTVFLHCLVDYPIQRLGVALVFFALTGALAAGARVEAPAKKRSRSRRRAAAV